MILEIFSAYGKLEAVPMTLQAIEKSIPSPEQEHEPDFMAEQEE